jgi:hypothetical protein
VRWAGHGHQTGGDRPGQLAVHKGR